MLPEWSGLICLVLLAKSGKGIYIYGCQVLVVSGGLSFVYQRGIIGTCGVDCCIELVKIEGEKKVNPFPYTDIQKVTRSRTCKYE